MKLIKNFNLFESSQTGVESLLGVDSYENINEHLIDFEHLGFTTDISSSSSYIIDFDKKESERANVENGRLFRGDQFYIRSYEVGNYNGGMSRSSISISLKSNNYIKVNIESLESAYDDLSHFLESMYGLVKNYIYIEKINVRNETGGGFGAQFIYFKDFNDIKSFLESANSDDKDNLNVAGITLGFYKKN